VGEASRPGVAACAHVEGLGRALIAKGAQGSSTSWLEEAHNHGNDRCWCHTLHSATCINFG
jgi:hypothetical protein